MKTAMMIAPHADDAAAFCGGTLAKLAAWSSCWRSLRIRGVSIQWGWVKGISRAPQARAHWASSTLFMVTSGSGR